MATTGYCELDDVRLALQEVELSDETQVDGAASAIRAVSQWFRKKARAHFYDTGDTYELVPTAPRAVENVLMDIPSSPHAQDGMIRSSDYDVRYPVTTTGRYIKLELPHKFVETLDALRVRELGGEFTDWIADPKYEEGRGEDYYFVRHGQEHIGVTNLYLNAHAIGQRYDFQNVLEIDYQYGLNYQDEEWDDVRDGIAYAVAARLVVDDDVLTAIPNDGQLIGVDTQRQRLVDDARTYLGEYLTLPVE